MTAPKKPRASAIVKNKEKVEDVKPVEASTQPEEQPKPKPRPRRPRSKKVEEPKTEEPKKDAVEIDEPEETVTLPEKKVENIDEIDPRLDEANAASYLAEIDRLQESESFGNRQTHNYTIGTTLESCKKLTDEKVDYYPFMMWERDPRTLEQMAIVNIQKAEANGGVISDAGESIISLQQVQASVTQDRHYTTFYNRPDSNWNNHLMYGQEKVRPTRLNFATKKHGSSITERSDDQLLALMSRRLKLGTPINVKLWHSGLIFQLKPLSKEDSVEMLDRLNNAHLEVLRRTTGVIHGATSYYANRIIVQQFMKLVFDSNIDSSHYVDIQKLVDHRDIQMMAWGLFACTYQRGYNFVHFCGSVVESKDSSGNVIRDENGEAIKSICSHRTTSIIDPMVMNMVDQSSFNDWQVAHMARKLSSKKDSIEDIYKYQRLGRLHERSIVEIGSGIEIAIKAPKIDRHIRVGEEWLKTVEQSVDDVLRSDADEDTRNSMIQTRMYVTNNMDIAHWIDAIIIDGEETSSEEFINRMLRTFGNNEEILVKVYNEVRKAIADRVAAVIAIPTHKCPKCQKLTSEIEGRGDVIYTPIDMVSRFFTLAARNQ